MMIYSKWEMFFKKMGHVCVRQRNFSSGTFYFFPQVFDKKRRFTLWKGIIIHI